MASDPPIQNRNRWGIPAALAERVIQRDSACIYCGVVFARTDACRAKRPSWEHIVNDARIVTDENIALCCIGCNASKGAKLLGAWLSATYCTTRGISPVSIAPVARAALQREQNSG